MDSADLAAEFARRSGRSADGVWSAPGRATLIGEHLDYNGGLVLPVALGLRTRVAAAARTDGRVRCWSLQQPRHADLPLGEAGDVHGWAAYAVGTVVTLAAAGAEVSGIDLLVDGDVPLGGGLASSAALECAVALAVDDLTGARLSRLALARAGQRTEHVAVGAPVGIMDQFASMFGAEGHAVLLDTATMDHRLVTVPLEQTSTQLVVFDTRSQHDLADGGYADRRHACERAAGELGVDHLAGVDPARLVELADETLRRRARHVVTEQRRVRDAAAALERHDMRAVGELLTASHASLRDDFEVSVPELDCAVEAAVMAGALGARLTGGGFGGCVVALVADETAADVEAAVRQAAQDHGWPKPTVYSGCPRGSAWRDI